MSIMILHDKTNNNWNSQGLGPLHEAMNPKVTRERNGIYELTFTYPVKGVLFKKLVVGRWIVADAGPSRTAKAQKFEIAEITKPKNGIVTVYCEHYSYQLLRSIVKLGSKFENINAQTALNQLKTQMEPKGDFTFYSDVTTRSSLDFSDPSKFNNAQEVLGGVQGSILDNFGGEYLFNNNQVRLLANAGIERNVIIAYGKNLTDISQEESIENTFTSVYGWAKLDGEDEQVITLPETYLDSEYVDHYTQRRIQMVDFSDKKPKNVSALREMVKSYIKTNKIGIPKVSIKTSYVDLASSVMDEELKHLEELDLCDWVTVLFNELEIHTSAQIIKTVWNVSLDKFDSLELGETATNMSKVLSESQPDTNKLIDKVTWLEEAQKEASNLLNNPGKGHVVIYPSFADPQEILIMDTKDVNTAKNVWKWNAGGLGFSSTGYKGTYSLAMTNNGAIVADRMTTGTLRAIQIMGVTITGSTITSESGSYKMFLNSGQLRNYVNSILRTSLDPYSFNVYDGNSIKMMALDSSGVNINKKGSTNLLGYLGRGRDAGSGKEEIAINVESGNIGSYSVKSSSSATAYTRQFAVSSAGAHIGTLNMGGAYVGGSGRINNAYLYNTGVSSAFTVYNNVPVNFYSNLNMNGYSITNQSDMRLKENIEPTVINGIEETKKLKFYDFNRKQNYKNRDAKLQPSKKRELGLLAQESSFLLAEDKVEEEHYLSLDTSKQIMLNSLTNKQLIEKVEQLENKLNIKQKGSRKAQTRKGRKWRTKH